MKLLVISPKNRTVYNFRGDLIKAVISLGHEVIVTGPDKTDVDKIEKLGASFLETPINKKGTNIIEDLKYRSSLKRIIKSEKPDIVFCYTVKPIVYGAYVARKFGVKKIVSMITGAGYAFTSSSKKAKILKPLIKFLYKKGLCASTDVIFQNPDDMNLFLKLKLVNKDTCQRVNGSGVNMERFSKAPLPEKTVFFMLARILHTKGVLEYAHAAELVKSKYPNVDFVLLGEFESTADAVSKDELMPFINKGIITRLDECEDVVPHYHNCSVFVLPSYGEGVPRSALEAMSCGRAIITTNASGCKETVIDGENGFIVPVGDKNEIANKMIKFIEDPSLIQKMGDRSFEYCLEKFEVNKVNKDMLSILGLK